MQKYANLSGNSGIDEFSLGPDYINVKFIGGPKVYTYSHLIPGRDHVEKMKAYALAGKGLSTYINQHMRTNYESVEG